MPVCNKCNRDGLKWGKKTLKDGQVINILLEADGSEHRPYKDGAAKCNPNPLNTDPNQERLPQTKPESKATTDITEPRVIEKVRHIWQLFRVNATQLAIVENIGNLFSDHKEAPFTFAQEEQIDKIFVALLEISRSRLM